MTKNQERAVIIIGVVIVFIFCIYAVYDFRNSIIDAGGIKQIIVDTGKEIKDIIKEIEKD